MPKVKESLQASPSATTRQGAPLILSDWQNTLTPAQTDNRPCLPQSKVWDNVPAILAKKPVASGRALDHFKPWPRPITNALYLKSWF